MRYLILVIAILAGPGLSFSYQFSGAGSLLRANPKTPINRLLEEDIQFFRKMLDQEKVDFRQIRSRAVTIGLAAHFSITSKGNQDGSMAALRINAMRLADPAETMNIGDARKIVQSLSSQEKSEATEVPASLQKYLDDIRDLHNLMKPKAAGGLGIDLEISALARDDQPLTKQDREGICNQAYRTAVIAQATEAWFAKKYPDKKIAKALGAWAVEMGRVAGQLRIAAGSESDSEVRKDASNLRATCVACHRFFVNGIMPPPPKNKKKS